MNLNIMKYSSFIIIILLSLMDITFIIEGGSFDISTSSGQDLSINGFYNVTSYEVWDDVYVLQKGVLNVTSVGSMVVKNIYLQSGSRFLLCGGYIAISNSTAGGSARLQGQCDEFRSNSGSILNVWGAGGGNTMKTSHGGDAILDINCSRSMNISGSSINLIGGNGYDLPASSSSASRAWTTGTVLGYVSAGGNATIRISSKETITFDLSYVNLTGGRGGRASDGGSGTSTTTGKGGGYSNGGSVLENVGKGGNCSLSISCRMLFMNDTNFSVRGGSGGKAGKGGSGGNAVAYSQSSGKGGGGGGYGGGNGGAGGGSARVEGYIGSGGSCVGNINVGLSLRSKNSTFRVTGGAGGAAGDGGTPGLGDWAAMPYLVNGGGGGGGGYGGGGGGNGRDYNGGNAYVGGSVGIGGSASLSVDVSRDILLNGCIYNCTGGNGGRGGNGALGGPANSHTGSGAPGGGGYGGGGGCGGSASGWSDPLPQGRGGSTNVKGDVGRGGRAVMMFNCSAFRVNDTSIRSVGGTGGQAGNGGGAGTTGGGGGGYGGGGAGDYGDGGSGNVEGMIGIGGNSTISAISIGSMEVGNSSIESIGGNGGRGGSGGSSSYSTNGGGGGGYSGDGGIKERYTKRPGNGKVTGSVGDGGASNITICCFKEVDFNHTRVTSRGGDGGIAPTSPGGGSAACRGSGNGRETDPGITEYWIVGMPYAFLINGSSYTVNRTSTVNFTIEASDDADDENELNCFAAIRSPSNSSCSLSTRYLGTSPSGSWVCNFTPPKDALLGIYLLEISMEDTDGNIGPSALFPFEVMNNPPILNSISISNHTMLRNGSVYIETNASDLEDVPSNVRTELEYKSPTGDWVTIPGGSFASGNWSFVFDIGTNFEIGAYDIRSRAIDKDGGYSTWYTLEDTIDVENNNPYFVNLSLSTNIILRNHTLNVNVTAMDIEDESGSLNISLDYFPPSGTWTRIGNGTFDDGKWTFSLDVNSSFEIGDYSFRVDVTDLDGNSSGVIVFRDILLVKNNLPYLVTDLLPNATEDQEYVFNITVGDVESESLTVKLVDGPGWLSIHGLKLYGIPGNDHVGKNILNISVDDGDNITYWILNVQVMNTNDDPFSSTTARTVCLEDEKYTQVLDATDIDPTNDTLTWEMITDAPFLSLEDGVVSGTPGNEHIGFYFVNLTLSDGNGGSFELFYVLEVVNVNDDPVIITENVVDVLEDTCIVVDYDAYDIDPTNDSFTWSLVTDSKCVSINRDTGELVIQPQNKDVGVHFMNISVEDGNGGMTSTLFNLTIINVNDDPTIETVETQYLLEDEMFLIQMNGSDIDPTDDTFLWTMQTDSKFLSINSETGLISGTPTNDDVGIFWINITVMDGKGGSAYMFFNIFVRNVNDPPEAIERNISFSIAEDTILVDELPLHFIDIDRDDLTYRALGDQNCTIEVNSTWFMTVTPDPDWNGIIHLMIYANDSLTEDFMNILINVTGVNDPPFGAEILIMNFIMKEGDNHTVIGKANDNDLIFGDALRYMWSSNLTGYIGEGAIINLSLPPGHHRINLTVSDLEDSSDYAYLDVYIEPLPEIEKDRKGKILFWIIVLSVITVLSFLVVLFIFIFLRRKKEEVEKVPETVEVTPAPQVTEGTFERIENLREAARSQGVNISARESQYTMIVNLRKSNMEGPVKAHMMDYTRFLESNVKLDEIPANVDAQIGNVPMESAVSNNKGN